MFFIAYVNYHTINHDIMENIKASNCCLNSIGARLWKIEEKKKGKNWENFKPFNLSLAIYFTFSFFLPFYLFYQIQSHEYRNCSFIYSNLRKMFMLFGVLSFTKDIHIILLRRKNRSICKSWIAKSNKNYCCMKMFIK
jgi:hypothetical protein